MATQGGFHEGEIAVQRRAECAPTRGPLEGMLDPADLSGGAGRFLALRTFAVLTGRDRDDTLWISPLTGRPGFLDGAGTVLRVGALPPMVIRCPACPIPQQVGLLVIDFATRRRMRINGELFDCGNAGILAVSVQQAYGNCPAIHPAACLGRRQHDHGSRRIGGDNRRSRQCRRPAPGAGGRHFLPRYVTSRSRQRRLAPRRFAGIRSRQLTDIAVVAGLSG